MHSSSLYLKICLLFLLSEQFEVTTALYVDKFNEQVRHLVKYDVVEPVELAAGYLVGESIATKKLLETMRNSASRGEFSLSQDEESNILMLTAFGKHYQIELQKQNANYYKGAFLEYLGSNNSYQGKYLTEIDCFYSGIISNSVNNNNSTNILLNGCDGYEGIIKTESSILFIEPMQTQDNLKKNFHRKHIVYRREDVIWKDVVADTMEKPPVQAPTLHSNSTHKRVRRSSYESFLSIRNRSGRKIQLYYVDDYGREVPFMSFLLGERRGVNTFIGTIWIAKDSNTKQTLYMNGVERYVAAENSVSKRHPVNITTPRGMVFDDIVSNEVEGDEHFIEVMIVADPSVTNFHGKDKVEKYILTMMGIASEVFDEQKIGVRIKLQVVRMVLIEDSRSSFRLYKRNPTRTLVSACEFISNLQNENENHVNHFDFAVVLTREDFGPSGYAQLYSMCSSRRSCVLVQDEGLTSAFIVAHETGHLLGLDHDGDGESSDCNADSSQGSIMAPIIVSRYDRYHWSRCSKEVIKQNVVYFHCLKNRPSERKVKTGTGAVYTLDEQCQFNFDKSVQRCESFTYDPCGTLWCADPKRHRYCRTMHSPALEGTICGRNKACSGGRCTESGNVINFNTITSTQKPVVNGNWGSWFSWSACSQSCGIGVRTRIRICDSPRPDPTGKPCKGDALQRDICNTHECQTVKSFYSILDEQCEAKHGRGWTLYTDKAFETRLKQRQNNLNCTFNDGLCNWKDDTRNSKLPWLLNSGKTPSFGTGPSFDHTLKNGKGKYIHVEASSTPQVNKVDGDVARLISPVIRVPRLCLSVFYHMYGRDMGALEINILYSNQTEKTLWRIKDDQGNKWKEARVTFESVINYQIVIQATRGYHWAGDMALDDISVTAGQCEKHKNVAASTTCKLSCRSRDASDFKMNTGVTDGTTCRDDRTYDICIDGQCIVFGCDNKFGSLLKFDNCMICGGNGSSCIRKKGLKEVITTTDYDVIIRIAKGSTYINLTDVSEITHYFGVRKSANSGTYLSIGLNEYYNVQETTFQFTRDSRGKQRIFAKGPIKGDVEIVVHSFSNQLDKRVALEFEYYEPAMIEYSYKYEVKKWEECSRTCGTGRQKSISSCIRVEDETEVDRSFCRGVEEPSFVRVCATTPCQEEHRWLIRGWTECSTTCGSGFKTRLVRCLRNSDEAFVAEKHCSIPVPSTKTTCNLRTCPILYKWYAEAWGTCSDTCGGGIQTRKVYCIDAGKRQVVKIENCDGLVKPDTLQPCNNQECETFIWKVQQEGVCSKSCGGGFRARIVNCINEKTSLIVKNEYCDGPSPLRITACNPQPCPEYVWYIGESSPCSKSCGEGIKIRDIRCIDKQKHSTVNDNKCPGIKPESQVKCNERSCVSYRVAYSTWSTCSAVCGLGTQKRSAYCVSSDYQKVVSAENCAKGDYDLQRACRRSACALPSDLKCDFDHKSFCNWINIQSDDFDWSIAQRTPSVNTGPVNDHTTNVGYFAYIEASLPRRQYDRAQITSPYINVPKGCLMFYYHMKGSSIGKLSVTLATKEKLHVVFEKEKKQSSQWLLAKVELKGENLDQGYRFIIEGTVGYGVYGDIAIDDISFYEETCDAVDIIPKKVKIPLNCREISPYCSHHMRDVYCKESKAYRALCCKTCAKLLAYG